MGMPLGLMMALAGQVAPPPITALWTTAGPMSAASPDGALRVVVTATVGTDGTPLAAHALVRRPGALVSWTELPRPELPLAAIPIDPRVLHLVYGGEGAHEVVTLSSDGTEIGRTSIEALLPVAAHPSEGAIYRAMPTGDGAHLAVPLQCGSLALVRFDAGAPVQPYGLCELLRPEKYNCSVAQWLEQARTLQRAGDEPAALWALETAVETNPLDARPYRALSQFHDRRGEEDRRIACLALAVERLHQGARGERPVRWRVGTPEVRLVMDYVRARADRGGPQEAHAALDVALELYPGLAEAVLMRAEYLLDDGREDDAIDVLSQTLARVEPGEGLESAHADVGRFLLRHDRPERALRFLEDAFALGDRSAFLLRTLSEVSAELGDMERAVLWLERLADTWRSTLEGEESDVRRARGLERLTALELEIEALRQEAADPH